MLILLKDLLSHLMESLIQVMDSELQFQMVGIHASLQLSTPGFEHLKMMVMQVNQCGCFPVFMLHMKMLVLQV